VSPPVCTIIAGPNGAGKTTFALTYLPETAHCRNFVNADLIAAGLSPLSPERERVAHGGHDIPRDDIIRRYPRSIGNLLEHYSPLCSSTICLDNSGPSPEVIFMQDANGRVVESQAIFEALLKRGEK